MAKQEYMDLRASIVKWLRDYLQKSKKNGCVLGMSGGIDSSIIALLAKEATHTLGKKVLALILPINNDNDYYDESAAVSICNEFGIEYKIINLASSYEALKAAVNNSVNQPVTYTNLKARLRECAIYFHANNLDYLVLGTVNRGEYTIGYFPKNATAGDILPIADLLKKEIREIGRSYSLAEEIVSRKASGCICAKTAEEEWGFSEEELDRLVETLDRGEESLKRIHGISRDKIERFLELYRSTDHKRKYYPIYKKER